MLFFFFFFFRSIDEYLPKLIFDATQAMLSALGSITVATIVNPFLLLPLSILGILVFTFRKIYLKSSKHIKRLEGIGELINKSTTKKGLECQKYTLNF